MRRLWRYRQFRIGFTALILLIAILMTQHFYRRTIQWFSLLGDSGLVETQGKITAVNPDGSIIQIKYEFTVPDGSESIRTYYGSVEMEKLQLTVYDLPIEVQAWIPIEYTPEAPEFSVVSKRVFGQRYAQLLEDYMLLHSDDKIFPWCGSLMIGVIAFITLLLQGVRFLRPVHDSNANKPS